MNFASKSMRWIIIALVLMLTSEYSVSQSYEMTLQQRRRFNQIHVEVWAKAISENSPKLGYASLIMQYNPSYLKPADIQESFNTDSINVNVNQINPVDSINSGFHLVNGYQSLNTRSYGEGFYSLEVTLSQLGNEGIIPSSSGKGSFIGKVIFDIIDNPSATDLTLIEWSKSALPGNIQLFDADSSSIKSTATWTDPGDFTVTGITILSPNKFGQVVDRDEEYGSLSGAYTGGGYPLYFERSVSPALYQAPVDEDIAYDFEYSLDNGSTWINIGRVRETDRFASVVGDDINYLTGEIFNPDLGNSFTITTHKGRRIDQNTYRHPLRVVWAENPYFTFRSEQARIRATILTGSGELDIWQESNSNDINDDKLVLGRLFFTQLNGVNEYLKSNGTYSNATQLTVEAWINLNSYQPNGSEPAIVVSSAGSEATPYLGSREGAWMLYLEDGKYPAFRAREIEARGTDGYIGKLVAYERDFLNVVSDAEPLTSQHAENWVHVAATVNDNNIKLYVNGELTDEVTNTQGTDIRMMTSNHPIWIGVNPNTRIEADDFLHAGIKGVKIWRTALTQDELRRNISGVVAPTNITGAADLRKALQMYYTLEGNSRDNASDVSYQFGDETIDYFVNGVISQNTLKYRPDMPHIKITSPTAGAGILNKDNEVFEVRWISYGIGDITATGTNDVTIEYSTNNGSTWTEARNPDGDKLGSEEAVDVELNRALWEPYNNNDAAANLRTINPYSRLAKIRVRGNDAFTQSTLNDIEGDFYIAPYFAIQKTENSILTVAADKAMNLSTNDALIEAWIRPYRFPTDEERFFPIIEKVDSVTNNMHYALRLLSDGGLEFRVTNIAGDIISAFSDKNAVLPKPNSIELDTAWTHVAVQLSKNSSTQSDIIFYIDGTPQLADSIRTQLGSNLTLNSENNFPLYIGYKPNLVQTAADTVTLEPLQTQTIILGGNVNSGTPQDATREAITTIYDGAGNAYEFNAILTKTANNNEYRFTAQIDNNEIPTQTENINLTGNINSADPINSIYTTSTVIRDYNGTDHTLDFVFTKTAANNYQLEAFIGTDAVSQSAITFLPGGAISTPVNVVISAADLNTVLGENAFDEATPKNIRVSLISLTNSNAENNATADAYDYLVRFNANGNISSPYTIRLNALDINSALGNTAFDQTSPKNITVVFAEVGNEAAGVTQTAGNDTFTITDQDGRTQTTIVEFGVSAENNFIGEIREVRFWNGLPNNVSKSGSEPTALTKWIQGAMNIYAENLNPSNNANLYSAFSFNGGALVNNGYTRAAATNNNNSVLVKYYGDDIKYVPSVPYLKLIEPVFRQQVANSDENLKVRWAGFNYDAIGFTQGSSNNPPSLEFSIRGGGGNIIQPYQYLGGQYWVGNPTNSISYPDSNLYRFDGTGSDIMFAARVNAGIADPDENNDGLYNDQGPLSASLTNARLRLNYKYTINGESKSDRTEGPLFTVTPASNFTVRVLLEGYHDGNTANNELRNLGTSFADGGLRIKLYSDNSGTIGSFVAQSESFQAYDNRNPLNRDRGTNRFANVNFIFTDLNDGNYWVVVEHPNHLPVMSRFAAPFMYEGDDRTTWNIESGWDFQTWDGTDLNVLQTATADPYEFDNFTAFGDAVSTQTLPQFSTTGLIFNDGQQGTALKPMPALVGGDVDQSGQIDAADRVLVRLDDGTQLVRSDITGDKVVNADDRTIVDRNFGHVSSIYNVNLPDEIIAEGIEQGGEYSPSDSELFGYFNNSKKNKISSNKKANIDHTQADAINYQVNAQTELDGNFVNVHFYIKNLASKFALANCTFAVQYDPSILGFTNLLGADSVIFSDKPEKGYVNLRTAPRDESDKRFLDVRSIEVDYDAYGNPGGELVPYDDTYLGTLRFGIKNKNDKITFKWHYSTSVHTTDGYIVTEKGTFGVIPPIRLYDLDLTYPDGGESFSPNTTTKISWLTNASSREIKIQFSSNSGNTWYPVNTSQVLMGAGEYEWTVPNENSTRCLIRVLDAEDNEELDRSRDFFSILPSFAQIIRPSSADPIYAGGSNGEITWVTQGYDKVYFEFSSDCGVTWTKATNSVAAELRTATWKIPAITTKCAYIRMMNDANGIEIARSGQFQILAGTFTFSTPKAGETLFVDNFTRIRWATKNVQEFDLDISYDGGFSWDKLAINLDARQQSYLNWTVTNNPTENAIIRATWQGDANMEYARTGTFRIVLRTSVNEIEIENLNIFPNPASEFINITAGEIIKNIEIIALDGTVLLNVNEINHTEIKLNVHELTSGTYILKIHSRNGYHSEEVKVVR